MDGYATHIEPLVKAALESKGDILELGCGDYSTPILALIAKSRGCKLYVKASDPVWASRYKDVENCEIEIVDWATWKVSGHYGLIFLDNEEHAPQRVYRMTGLLSFTDCLVMHDASQAVATADLFNVLSGKEYTYYDKHDPATVTVKC